MATETQIIRAVEQAPSEQPENVWSSFLFAWRRKELILFALIAGAALAYLKYNRDLSAYLKIPPSYSATTEFLVAQKQAYLPIQGVPSEAGYSSPHNLLITSPAVIEDAIKTSNLQELRFVTDTGNPIGAILTGLTINVSSIKAGDLITLTFTCRVAEDCPIVLDAIVKSYQKFLEDLHHNTGLETLNLISRAKDELDEDLKTLDANYRRFIDESPLLQTAEGTVNQHYLYAEEIDTKRRGLRLEITDLKARVESLKRAMATGLDEAQQQLLLATLFQRDVSQPTVVGGAASGLASDSDMELMPLLMQEQSLLTKYGPDHPDVVDVRNRMQFVKQLRSGFLAEAASKPVSLDGAPAPSQVEQRIRVLDQQIRFNEFNLAELDKAYDEAISTAKGLDQYDSFEREYQSERARKNRLFDAVVNRLEEINLAADTGGTTVRVVRSPGEGRRLDQAAPGFSKILITYLAMSLMCGAGLAFVVDSADRSFRSPEEVREELHVNVFGHIPMIPEAVDKAALNQHREGLAPQLRTFHEPRGRVAEAYRAVRTAIYFSTRGGGHKVIQVTSPSPGDGKSTMAANLAISIAQSGRSVILIDADFRRPRVHKLFGMKNAVGMASVIAGQAELKDAIIPTEVDNLSVISCGPRPENPAELLTRRDFETVLNSLRDQFELVIVDSPPILAISDPLNVAPRVDGVLVVLRLNKKSRKASRQTVDALEEVGANVLGVVINGVGDVGGKRGRGAGRYAFGYGRSNSLYGYGYGYGYSYGYGSRNYSYGAYEETQDAEKYFNNTDEDHDTTDSKSRGTTA